MNFQESKNRLEKIVEKCEECKFATCEQCEINWSDVQAISIVLGNLDAAFNMYESAERENKRLRKKVKQLKEENEVYVLNGNNVALEIYIKNKYIPKQKIKDKVKELKQLIERTKNDDQYSHEIPLYEHDIQILEELLKESCENCDMNVIQ